MAAPWLLALSWIDESRVSDAGQHLAKAVSFGGSSALQLHPRQNYLIYTDQPNLFLAPAETFLAKMGAASLEYSTSFSPFLSSLSLFQAF